MRRSQIFNLTPLEGCVFDHFHSILIQTSVHVPSGVTDGGQGGKCPPWQLRCGPLFRNGDRLIRLPFTWTIL